MLLHPNRTWKPAAAVVLLLGLASAQAAADGPKHGLSAFGDLAYPADFKHFKWVNPDAPKGGRMAMIGTRAIRTFDSFNDYILKGDAAQGLGSLFVSLMTSSLDEPDAVYGLVAHSVELSPDRTSITFWLRPEAKFADGSALTSADVAFSFDILRSKGHPYYRLLLKDVAKAEAIDAHTVRYTFTGPAFRDLPLLLAGLPIFSKAYYATREFDQTTLDPPLGSGPYKIGDYKVGQFVSYLRRDDYWGKHLPVNRGRSNFDEVRYLYFYDRAAELMALKAGEFDLREEFTAKDWTTGYEVAAVKEKRLITFELPDARPSGAQGFYLNTRRPKFADARVRKAFDYAFDFEYTNKAVFDGQYIRAASPFENTTMKAQGKPSAAELALLEPFRDRLPAEAFEEAYRPPVSDGTGKERKFLQAADKLLGEAGWQIKDGKRVNAKGDVLDVEFLISDPTSERVLTGSGYLENLKKLGIVATIRRVDPAQYERRRKTFDFDVLGARYSMRITPGLEMRNFWSSDAAKTDGTPNLAGISHPAVDALIAKAIDAKSRQELEVAMRALDRVLRAGHYWVPNWYKGTHWMAHWDKYSRPAIRPLYDRGIDSWWYDAAKATKLKTN